MITHCSHVSVWVTDQDLAKDFYCNTLGFEVYMDIELDDGRRWLSVHPKTQPELKLSLRLIAPSTQLSTEKAKMIAELVKEGSMGASVFNVDNCQTTYEKLLTKGVEFKQEPTEQFYGIEALMVDPFGNIFSLVEPKNH